MKKLCSILSLCFLLVLFSGCMWTKQMTSTQQETSHDISTESKKVASLKNDNKVDLSKEPLLPGVKKIVDRGKLRVAMINTDFDGFIEQQEDGSVSGIDGQLAKEIADSLGVSLEINRESNTYNKMAELLIEGKVDLIISMYSLTTSRSASIKISKPYLVCRRGVMINKQELIKNNIEKNPIDYMKDNEIKIAVLKESYDAELLKEVFPHAKALELSNYNEMCDAVKNGDAFGFFGDEIRFLYNCFVDKELLLYTESFIFSDLLDNYCIGVSPDNNDLLNFVNSYIDSSKKITIKDYENTLKEKFDKK